MKKISFIIGLSFLFSACNTGTGIMEEKARIIHEQVLTVDSHTDTPWALLRGGYNLDRRHDFIKDKSRVDFPRMREGGLDAVFMAAFVGQGKRDEEGNRKAWEKVTNTIDSIHVNLERSEEGSLALTPGEAYELEKKGKRIVFIGIENGYAIGKELSNIEKFYNQGARYITLCHTRNNDICDSSTDSTEHNGLSEFGVNVVKEMNRVGMMIDITHTSDSTVYQVLKLTKYPVIASHSCARALCDNPRNLNDDMLVQLAKNGGVVQVCLFSDYVKKPEPNPLRDSVFRALNLKYRNFTDLSPEVEKEAWREWDIADSLYPRKLATISNMVDHIDHIVKVAGIDHVGIGSDFDGGGELADCRDVSRMEGITLELVKRGYTKTDIAKIWGGNLMRVMAEVQKANN